MLGSQYVKLSFQMFEQFQKRKQKPQMRLVSFLKSRFKWVQTLVQMRFSRFR